MKRSADNALCQSTTRYTRSVAHREQKQEHEAKLQHERAADLMSTPTLRALPAVLSSGFLYQHECMTAASSCKNWYHAWKEVEDQLPPSSKIEVFVEDIGSHRSPALWVERDGIKETIGSHTFVRQVLEKVHALKVAAKTGEAAQARAKAALPVVGVDIQVAIVSYWGPNSHNGGGLAIAFGKKKNFQFISTGAPFLNGRAALKIRLDPELRLWTGIRTWSVYDEQPLWP